MASWLRPVIYTLLCIVILGLAGYAFLQDRKQKAEAARWKRIADQKYKEGRSEASQILRAAVDQISDDKNRLSGLSDRELLTESLLALAGLGRRMDRIEDNMHALSRFEDLLKAINEQAEILTQNADLLIRQVTEAQNAAASFHSAVSGTGEAVYSLSDSTHSLESVLEDLSGQINSLAVFSDSLSDLHAQTQQVLLRMNQTLKVTADNPAAAISQMDSRISSVYSLLENMSEGLNLMAESLEGVQETLDAASCRTCALEKGPSPSPSPARDHELPV